MICLNVERVKPDAVRGALFLDRDGTLIEHVAYLHDPTQVKLAQGVKEALVKAESEGLLLFLFTNQSGVGRGFFTLEAALACNAAVGRLLGLAEPVFAAECTAPEHPGEPLVYRKPSPRFIEEMVERFALDPARCWMIGDQAVDMEAAKLAGINGLQVGVDGSFGALVDRIVEDLSGGR
jgi:D-glycero-D-manno-heptose 1,7-bisphosphate phosphatase